MVVAARARHGDTDHRLGHGVDALVDDVVGIVEAFAHGDEAERSQARIAGFHVGQLIRGKLFDQEVIPRLVVVERLHHVVAVGPRRAVAVVLVAVFRAVALEPDGVAVARAIEPVTAPTFAVVR